MFRKIWNRLFGPAISATEIPGDTAAAAPPDTSIDKRKAEVAPDGPAFAGFNLHPSVAQGIRDAGFQRCTPIQAQTLPLALAGKDVAGQAQTGTGKTAAFLVSMFQTLLTRPPHPDRHKLAIRGIVIAPTRELAVQIHNDAL